MGKNNYDEGIEEGKENKKSVGQTSMARFKLSVAGLQGVVSNHIASTAKPRSCAIWCASMC